MENAARDKACPNAGLRTNLQGFPAPTNICHSA
jgi:hypothetical protein